jgi:acetyltransferase-like isoleucine patch superfamily enzyme
LYLFRRKWRRQNRHNFTTAFNKFPIEKVVVGKYTYGRLHVLSWGAANEALQIGNFVSIANNVRFYLGGNHRNDTLTTYPLKVIFCGEEREDTTKGKITVEDDVWIGTDVSIMSGITIGKGAIVAAGSVVTKNVPEYAVVAGNPAQVKKYRFNNEIIKKLIEIDLARMDKEFIKKNIDLLNARIDETVIEKIRMTMETK